MNSLVIAVIFIISQTVTAAIIEDVNLPYDGNIMDKNGKLIPGNLIIKNLN